MLVWQVERLAESPQGETAHTGEGDSSPEEIVAPTHKRAGDAET